VASPMVLPGGRSSGIACWLVLRYGQEAVSQIWPGGWSAGMAWRPFSSMPWGLVLRYGMDAILRYGLDAGLQNLVFMLVLRYGPGSGPKVWPGGWSSQVWPGGWS